MHQVLTVCAGALLLMASMGLSSGCGDDDGDKGVTADGSAATAGDGGGSVPRTDGGVTVPSLDGGGGTIDGGLSTVDGAVSNFDGSAEIENPALPIPARAVLSGPEFTGVCETFVNEANCDKTKLPIVFVHGTVANADSFAHPAKLFASNGYCAERIRGIEYHSLIGTVGDAGFALDRAATYAAAKKAIDAEIEKLRAEYGVTKVDLAGHSQGAGHGAKYAGENPDKVAHYINLAGGDLPADPGGVPTLAVSSVGDRPANSKTTTNFVSPDRWLDHSAVASSTEAFVEMYKFLNAGKEPTTTTVQCGTPILVEGKAQTFADNQPLPGTKIEVYELGESPRERGAPVQSYTLAGEDTKFGPFEAKAGVAYEFKIVPPPGDTTRRPSHTYVPPFVRSDRLIRLNIETKDRIAGSTSSQVNRDESFAVIIPRNRQTAFLAGRDTVTVDGFEVLSRANTLTASPLTTPTVRSAVVAALYLYDRSLTPGSFGPGDGKTTGESIVKGSFVNSADVFIPTATPKFVEVKFNGRTLKVPNWPSATEGASVVLLN